MKNPNKEKILEMIKKAGNEEYETSWDERGIPVSKKKSEIQKGKKSRSAGANFELRVRKDLEDKGRIVDKWTNNIDFEKNKIVPAKRKYNPFKKMLVVGTGFPDFVSIKHIHDEVYSVIGVEVKTNGTLSKEEKQKCAWYLKNKIFSEIWVAKKGQKKGQIEYDNFSEKYGKKYMGQNNNT
ncbi:MAG: hypothetical protein Q8P15_01140 [Nanoarchaeota archaeon]|nr:hypothetical protein [Nanoarchaeota archaeon]